MIELAAAFILLWSGFYYVLYQYLLSQKSPDYVRRVITILHWVVSSGLSTALYCKYFNLADKIDKVKLEDVAIMNALTFILFDLIWNLYYRTETALMTFNHGVLLTTAVLYLYRRSMRRVFIEGYTLITATEPLLHLRFFLKQSNKGYKTIEYLFIVTFITIRAGLISYFVQKYINDENVDQIDKALLLANYTTGLIFCINIVGYLRRKRELRDTSNIL